MDDWGECSVEGIFDSRALRLLEKGLDTASLRHQVISNNLANVDTPNFKRSEVAFEDELAKALANQGTEMTGVRTNPRHIPIGQEDWQRVGPKVAVQQDTSLRNDGNNVDIDQEMIRLAQNSMQYEALTQLISQKLSGLKSVIKEAR